MKSLFYEMEKNKQFFVQENSLAVGACCWFIGLALSAVFYFTGLSRQKQYLHGLGNNVLILGAQMDARSLPCCFFRRKNISSLVLPFKTVRKFLFIIHRNRHPLLDSTSPSTSSLLFSRRLESPCL
jgi:hypothetical protein